MSVFTKRQAVTISNGSGGALTNYAVKLAVTYDDDMQADFGDLRFASASAKTYYEYWVESKTDSTSAVVWVKIPSLPTGDTVIYMYYGGNAGCKSLSSGHRTFPLGFEDDWSGIVRTHLIDQPTKLTTPTPDATGQALHPSVRYIPGGWAGYEYWMAYTPLAGFDENLEIPCLVRSADGITWAAPTGLTNPVLPGKTSSFHADPEIVYDPVADELRLYWTPVDKEPETDQVYFCMCKTSDGVNWEDPTGTALGATFDLVVAACKLLDPVSFPDNANSIEFPSIHRASATEWHMWYGAVVSGNYALFHRASADGVTWGDPDSCTWTITGHIPSTAERPYHASVMWSPSLEKYICTSVNYYSTTPGAGPHMALSTSTDGITFTQLPWGLLFKSTTATDWDNSWFRCGHYEDSDGNIVLYPSVLTGDKWIGRLAGYTTQDLIDLCRMDQVGETSASMEWWARNNKWNAGTVAVSSGVATLTPYAAATSQAIAGVNVTNANATVGVAVRARAFPSTTSYTTLGLGSGRISAFSATSFSYTGLANGYAIATGEGNWFVERWNDDQTITQCATGSGGIYADTYHVLELAVDESSNLSARLDDVEVLAYTGAYKATYAAESKRAYICQGTLNATAANCAVDWLLVRQSRATEPTSTFGAEAAGTWTVLSPAEQARLRLIRL